VIRVPTAVDERGWKHRFVTHGGTTTVALVVHLAILFAFAYESSTVITISDLPAAIAVEIVLAPPGQTKLEAEPQPATIDDQDSEHPTEMLQAKTTVSPPNQSAVSLTTVERAMPMVQPMHALKRSATIAIAEHRTSPKRRSPPLNVMPIAGQPGASESSMGGSTGNIATSEPPNVPSSWKTQLLSHLDRYKGYPEAARARRAEGTALLSFSMDRDGRVLGYHIVRSTGHSELDDEVLAMIERASPLPPAPPELHAQVVQLAVPVRFRL
jgi:periplasmic protein TonB